MTEQELAGSGIATRVEPSARAYFYRGPFYRMPVTVADETWAAVAHFRGGVLDEVSETTYRAATITTFPTRFARPRHVMSTEESAA